MLGSCFASRIHKFGTDFREPLNKSSAAEQRIFFPIHAEWKTGNTRSIPLFSILLSEEKSLAVSSCRFNQSFLRILLIMYMVNAICFFLMLQEKQNILQLHPTDGSKDLWLICRKLFLEF